MYTDDDEYPPSLPLSHSESDTADSGLAEHTQIKKLGQKRVPLRLMRGPLSHSAANPSLFWYTLAQN